MKLKRFRETITIYGETGIEGDDLEAVYGCDGSEIYIEVGGRRIAVYRGNGKWLSLATGWKVESSCDHKEIIVSYFNPTPQRTGAIN
jgi:hypothetical protein